MFTVLQYLIIDTNLEMALTDHYLARMDTWNQNWLENQVHNSDEDGYWSSKKRCADCFHNRDKFLAGQRLATTLWIQSKHRCEELKPIFEAQK